jgi:hypothetical protein
MLHNELTFADLEPDLRRIGSTPQMFSDMLRDFVTRNHGGQPPSSDFAIAISLRRTLQLLRTLPDGAGHAAFVEAWEIKFVAPMLEKAKRAEAMEQQRRRRRGGASGA